MRPNIPFNPDAEIPRIPRKSKRKCNENTEPKASWYIGICEKHWMSEIGLTGERKREKMETVA